MFKNKMRFFNYVIVMFFCILFWSCRNSPTNLKSLISTYEEMENFQYNISLNNADSLIINSENFIYENIDTLSIITYENTIEIKSNTWDLQIYLDEYLATYRYNDEPGPFYSFNDFISLLIYSDKYLEEESYQNLTNNFTLKENPFGIYRLEIKSKNKKAEYAEFFFQQKEVFVTRKFDLINKEISTNTAQILKNIIIEDKSVRLTGDFADFKLIDQGWP